MGAITANSEPIGNIGGIVVDLDNGNVFTTTDSLVWISANDPNHDKILELYWNGAPDDLVIAAAQDGKTLFIDLFEN